MRTKRVSTTPLSLLAKGQLWSGLEAGAGQQEPEDLSSGGGKAPPGGHITYPAK